MPNPIHARYQDPRGVHHDVVVRPARGSLAGARRQRQHDHGDRDPDPGGATRG